MLYCYHRNKIAQTLSSTQGAVVDRVRAHDPREAVSSAVMPFRRGVVELGPTLVLQFHKGFLHDITRPVAIAQDASRILQERSFEALEERVHLLAVDFRRFDQDALHFFSLSLTRELAKN
jgi:hypothetical protein